MANVRESIFFELNARREGARQGSDRVHCLIELEHAPGVDARLCWLEASVRAGEILQRMPTRDELRWVSAKAARRLARVGTTNAGAGTPWTG